MVNPSFDRECSSKNRSANTHNIELPAHSGVKLGPISSQIIEMVDPPVALALSHVDTSILDVEDLDHDDDLVLTYFHALYSMHLISVAFYDGGGL